MGIFLHPHIFTMKNIYKCILAEIELHVNFRYENTKSYFGKFVQECNDIDDALFVPGSDFIEFEKKWNMSQNDDTEYAISVYRFCDALLHKNCCIFHGAAFLWREKAFILTAASGVGKTTQLRHWQKLCGDELVVMNGDKPVLKAEDNLIMVYPSPWKGKECLGDDNIIAPLGGIIYLEQAMENRICRMTAREAVEPLIRRFLSSFDTEEITLAACKFEDSLLKSVPVWRLRNEGDILSAMLTMETLRKEVFGDEI